MKKTSLKLKKKAQWQIFLTVSTFIITVILPISGYFQFDSILSRTIGNLGKLKVKYNYVFITLTVIGSILTIVRYSMYNVPQYSIKQGSLNLANSIFFIVFLSTMAQLGNINITMENFSLNLNLIGVFVVLIMVWSLFIIKNLCDLLDFKRNQSYYEKLLRN